MTTTVRDFDRTIRAFVAEGSGLDSSLVIPGNDAHPRPKDAYATVLRVTPMRQMYPLFREGTEAQGTVTANLYRTNYSVQWYRKDANDTAWTFMSWLGSDLGLLYSEDNDFRVYFPPAGLEVNRLDDVIGEDFEERAQMDLMVDHWIYIQQAVGWIDALNGNLHTSNTVSAVSVAVEVP